MLLFIDNYEEFLSNKIVQFVSVFDILRSIVDIPKSWRV